MLVFLGAKSQSGMEIVLDTVEFDAPLGETDTVISGEGK
jgi:glycerate kinase